VVIQIRTLATPLINDGEDAELASVMRLVVHKIHTPVLIRSSGRHDFAAQEGDALAPLDLHAHLRGIPAGYPLHPLLARLPAFALEHHEHAQVAEPWPAH